MKSISFFILFALLLPIPACSPNYSVVPVSGSVTLDGNPLSDAVVYFQPSEGAEPGPGSAGITNESGRYAQLLATPGPDVKGAVGGKHNVTIRYQLPDRREETVRTKFEVPAKGTDNADFSLPFDQP